jgi:asparagine synthase (glutamine-hydrolysing)
MCGIAGWIGVVPEAAQTAARVLNCLHHRGPDAQGMQLWDDAALLHTRLSIIDLAPTGSQPMANEDGSVWTIFNGEIYNHHALRQELMARGHTFRGRADTEILPHLYEDEGSEFLHRLRGMFALAIYDARRKTLVIARDRFGIKPLFYSFTPERFGFASEINALRQFPGIDSTPDLQAAADFAALFYIPAPLTFYKGITALLPGEVRQIQLEGGQLTCKQRFYHHWDITPNYDLTLNAAIEQAAALVDTAVRRQLESDVPLGAMLSGGIDSSLVCAAAQTALGGTLSTFNVRFPDAKLDETWAAAAVAEHIGSHHRTLDVRAAQGSWDYVTGILQHTGQPFADAAVFAVDSIAELMREHVTVALAGDGGDEGFGGYRTYGRVNSLAHFQRLPAWMMQSGGSVAAAGLRLAAHMGAVPQHIPARVFDITRSNDSTHFVQKMFCALPDDEHRRLIRGINVDPVRRLFEPQWTNRAYATPAEKLSAHIVEANLRVEMPNAFLFKTDIASMRRSLEIRVPMLDEDLFQFGLSIRHQLKVFNGQTKAVLRRVAERRLPPAIAQKPKQGFTIPVDTWVSAEFKATLRETLLGANSQLPRVFAPDSYRPFIEAFVEGRSLPGVERGVLYHRALMLLSTHLHLAAA